MKKRGQITLFIIIAIIIVALVVAFFVIRPEIGLLGAVPTYTQEVSQARDHIKSCINDVALPGIELLSLQGGRLAPKNYFDAGNFKVEYGYYEGQFTLPTKTDMEQELASFINIIAPACITPESFPNLEISELSEPQTIVDILDDEIQIEVIYPLLMKEADLETNVVESYILTYPIRLGSMYQTIRGIVSKEMASPDDFQVSYLLDSGFNVEILPFDDNTIIVYSVSDPQSVIEGSEFTFMFANKFTE